MRKSEQCLCFLGSSHSLVRAMLLSGIQSPANRPSASFRSASSVHQFYKFHFGQNLFISIESAVSVRLFTSCVLGNADCGYLYCRPRSPPLDMSIRCSTALGSGSQKYMGFYLQDCYSSIHIESSSDSSDRKLLFLEWPYF